MGKASDPPKCKACGKEHWGTCLDHSNRGYLSARQAEPEVKAQRVAKANEVLASKGIDVAAEVARVAAMTPAQVVTASKERKKQITAARKAAKSGGSSAVERRPSKPTVEGSTPSPRSKPKTRKPKMKSAKHGRAAAAKASKRLSTSITADGETHTNFERAITVDDFEHSITADELGVKRARGRPKTSTPEQRKAYKAEKERLRRAAKKQSTST